MEICFVTEGGIEEFWQRGGKKPCDVLFFGFNGLGDVDYARELAGETDFRQRFRILGLLHKGKAADEGELRTWAASPSTFRNHLALRALPPVVTLLNAACLALVVANVLPGTLWGILWFGCLTLSFCFTGRISRTQAVYGKKLQILGTYARLLHLMDGQPMHCPALQAIK